MSFCYVPKATNKKDITIIGKSVGQWRLKHTELYVEDVAYMTGLSRKTIEAFEAGGNTTLKNLLEITTALGAHPKEFFDVDFPLQPKFPLPAKRKERHLVSSRIRKAILETSLFEVGKEVKEIQLYLSDSYNIDVDSTIISVVLKRLSDEGLLKYKKSGRNNIYYKKKR